MGRAPCCDKENVKRGPWSPEEDTTLKSYIEKYGTGGNWIAFPQKAGLRRCGKSCRLRWLNYLRPNIKHGEFTDEEDKLICSLYANIGSRWSIIAAQLPGRTDNDIKNYWNSKLKKRLMSLVSSSQQIGPNYQSTSNSSISPLQEHSSLISAPHSYPPLALSFKTTALYTNNHCYPTSASTYFPSYESIIYTPSNNFLNSPSYMYNGVEEEQSNPKFFITNCDGYAEGKSGGKGCYVEENPLECSLEEIKQLIGTTSVDNNNFFLDENNIEEKVMLYTNDDDDHE